MVGETSPLSVRRAQELDLIFPAANGIQRSERKRGVGQTSGAGVTSSASTRLRGMSLVELLAAPVALGYARADGPGQAAQVALREQRAQLAERLPPGYRVRASGAAVNLPRVPWVAMLDEDVTTTAQEGFYLVYLFSADLQRAYLSMNQGVTAHRDRFKTLKDHRPAQAAIRELDRESHLLRGELQTDLSRLVATIDLKDDGFLARGYEAGNVIAQEYDMRALPDEATLRADLDRFLAIYKEVIEVRDRVLIEQPGQLHIPTRTLTVSSPRPRPAQAPIFRPKDASDYIANVPAQQQRRTRKHEELVRRVGEHARNRGWTPVTNVHPRDLIIRRASQKVMVEAKTVGNNAEFAVRDAIGQLFAYRHFLYRERDEPDPLLLALFSEPVGDAFVRLLAELGVDAAWLAGGEWKGSRELDGLLARG